MRRLLQPDGTLVEGARSPLGPDRLVEALRWMLLSRAVDARATALQRQGRFGTHSPVKGQEASVVGSALTLDPEVDWIAPSYRELPALVRHGYPLDRILGRSMGRSPAATRIPDGVKVLPNQVALATQLQHAVGLAWGLKLQGRPGVVMAFFGDGAASEGDAHEAMNLAGIQRAPIVFLLMNNQWAISTSRLVQCAGEYYRRAEGYGFPGTQVDGNDLLAVFEVVQEAVTRARQGHGPTLVECLTARLSFHNTTDNPSRYLPPGWLEQAEREDPIPRLEAYLAGLGLWDDATRTAMEAEVAEEVEAAVHAALAMPPPRPQDLFDQVYARPPQRVSRQRQELLRLLGKA